MFRLHKIQQALPAKFENERANYMNKTLALNCVGERKVAYRAKKKNSRG